MTLDETKLIKRAKKGDQMALVTVLRSQEVGLYASAVAMLRSSWDAQDAVQETLLEACANLATLRNPESFGAWLSTILTRKCLRLLQSADKTLPLGDLPGEGDVFIGTERDEEVLRAVADLPDEQRIVIALRFYLDLSYRDIEAATSWPSGTVKSRINRALRQLGATLGQRNLQP